MFKSLINLTKFPSFSKTCVESILDVVKVAPTPCLHITCKHSRKASERRSFNVKLRSHEGTEGETSIDIDNFLNQNAMFPDKHTPSLLFDGVPFTEIPICNIKTTRNNTIFSLSQSNGEIRWMHTCGIEGYKNTKKGTNIAAQTSAITFGTKVLEKGYQNIRVVVQGIGPGRMSSIKGLQMSGLNIVSVTDATRVSWNPLRARKPRRV